MNRCARCVIPDTRPDTHFVDGVCSACIAYDNRPLIDWDARKGELLKLLDRHDGKCIVPSSGGKDSTYQVLRLLELGADVTVVTATTCHLTEIGRANINNLARYARTIEVTPNQTVRAKLNRLSLTMLGDISWPEHVSIHRVPFRLACELRIPLVFYGECPTREYGGPPGSDETRRMTQRWASEFGGFLGMRAADFVGMEGITVRDMRDYLCPSDGELQAAGVEAHFLGQYEEWSGKRNADVAIAHGFQCRLPSYANLWKAENQDNGQCGIHDYFGWLKYGFGRLAAQVSVDVRAGRVPRATAIDLVKDRDGLFPLLYMGIGIQDVLRRIGMNQSAFMDACNSFINPALFVTPTVEWRQRLVLKEFA